MSTRLPTVISLLQKNIRAAHKGGIPPQGHIILLTRRDSTTGTHRMLPMKGHFSKIGKCNQTTKYIQTKIVNWANEVTKKCFKLNNKTQKN